VAGLIVEIVVLQGDRIVVVDPDDHALAVITDLIVAQQLLEPIEIAAIMKIEDLGIEYQDVAIVDATMPEVTDDVVTDLCHASAIDDRYVTEDECIRAAAANEHVIAAIALDNVVAARADDVLDVFQLGELSTVVRSRGSIRILRQQGDLDDVGLQGAGRIGDIVVGLIEMDLDTRTRAL
jgi:hypothetical protein